MIYIKRHKLIFIRVPKNASTAISQFMVENMFDPEDIISKVIYDQYKPSEKIFYNNVEVTHSSHMDIADLIKFGYLTEDEIKQCRIVGIIREPAERLLSTYLYVIKRNNYAFNPSKTMARVGSPKNFREILLKNNGVIPGREWSGKLQSSYMTYDGIDVGEWWSYEDIPKLIDDIVTTYGVDVKHKLRHSNKSNDDGTVSLMDKYYDEATLALVKKVHIEDYFLYEKVKQRLT